jgi:hypothetical protein
LINRRLWIANVRFNKDKAYPPSTALVEPSFALVGASPALVLFGDTLNGPCSAFFGPSFAHVVLIPVVTRQNSSMPEQISERQNRTSISSLLPKSRVQFIHMTLLR